MYANEALGLKRDESKNTLWMFSATEIYQVVQSTKTHCIFHY